MKGCEFPCHRCNSKGQSAYADEQREILRRIAESGLEKAHKEDASFVDIFQHLLDEIERINRAGDI